MKRFGSATWGGSLRDGKARVLPKDRHGGIAMSELIVQC